jgi:predicted aldo/keto reductase-like oxidoreductase
MIYRNFKDLRLSSLGFGAMRLPVRENGKIDENEARKMVIYAYENGINYFDTAFGYHDGDSERFIGEALSNFPRDTWYLASKVPGYDLANFGKVEAIFEEQLEKCGVGYFDFYLLHNVCEMNIDAYLNEKYGTLEYLLSQKKVGSIRHLGFSAHGGMEVMKRFLAACGDNMELCQIQLNYLDWTFQEAKAKVVLLGEYHIPVWVMEPLRGGKLAVLPAEYAARLKALRPEEEIPAWAFRFLQSIPGIAVVLSGMSSFAQLEDNIRTFVDEKPLNTSELDTLLDIAGSTIKEIAIPCTECRYCTSHCPQQLDIPKLLSLYNEHRSTAGSGLSFIAPMALMAVSQDKRPSACIACGKCKQVCPQNIDIPGALKQFQTMLDALAD